jgi:iron(III) transport system ATP-binding protein
MSTAVRVEARDVALAFGRTEVLRDIALVVEPGEFFTLLGPSGCGKSTLLRLIAGFNRAQRGAILIDGRDVTEVPPWKRDVGMVFQSYALWPHLTVAQNVAFGLEERRLARAEVRRKSAAALGLVGLAELADRRPHQLSGGQQQRVALARTLAIEPRVLLLDEPLSNLDAKLRVHMRHELGQLQKRLGITTIFVTHDQEEALTTSDRVAVMHHGVIQQLGTPIDLFDRPANRFVAEFVGTINVLPGDLQKSIGESVVFVSPQAGSFALPRTEEMPGHGAVTLAFRPHSLALAATGDDGARVWLDATVAAREFLGEFARYRVRVGGAELVADQMHFRGAPMFAPGARVRVGLDPAEVRVFRDEPDAMRSPARAGDGRPGSQPGRASSN